MGRVCVWTEPIGDAIEFHRAAVRSAIESGNLTFACYSTFQINTTLLLRNDPLDAVWRESERGLDFVQKARFRDIEDVIVSQQRLIATLQGRTANLATFNDAQFDEAAFEAQLTDDRMTMMICWYWVTKLQARFLAGDYATALAASQQAKRRLWALFDQVELVEYFYYTALAVAALYESASADEQRAWRELLTTHEEQLREWANNLSADICRQARVGAGRNRPHRRAAHRCHVSVRRGDRSGPRARLRDERRRRARTGRRIMCCPRVDDRCPRPFRRSAQLLRAFGRARQGEANRRAHAALARSVGIACCHFAQRRRATGSAIGDQGLAGHLGSNRA